jgi:putative PIN family toxin of toxin-antitoxin system
LRCVLDTNVFVSALLAAGSKPRAALDRVRQQGTILLSFATLTELYDVLSRKQFRRYIDKEDMRRFLAALTQEAHWVDVDVQISACRDPKDDKFLSLAVSGQATHIVTGDADLLALHPFRGIQILAPSEFLEAP